MRRWMIDRFGKVAELDIAKVQKHVVILSNGKVIGKTSTLFKLPFEAVNELNKRKSKNELRKRNDN
jgi:hypothetical protein